MVTVSDSDHDCNSPVYIYNTGAELMDAYLNMLESCYPEVEICGYKYAPSVIFRHIDPIAFRCGFNDYADCLLSDGEVSEQIIDEASNYLP